MLMAHLKGKKNTEVYNLKWSHVESEWWEKNSLNFNRYLVLWKNPYKIPYFNNEAKIFVLCNVQFLKKMLLDRQNSMSSLFAMGNEVAAGADPVDRKGIERQLRELMGRFENLTTGATQRYEDLQQAMAVAKDFQVGNLVRKLGRWNLSSLQFAYTYSI